jgi:O-antigen ligase
MTNVGFKIYLVFTVSWFLHLSGRIPALGSIRFDLLLVLIMTVLSVFLYSRGVGKDNDLVKKSLNILVVYIIIASPFSEWPGSVFRAGLPNFIKAVVFYYFTVIFIDNKKKLKIFIYIFIASQIIRVIEPLYLHITQGYYGSAAMMSNYEFMNRLSGAPSDVINPNGLAFIIVSIFPFLHYLARVNIYNRLIYFVFAPLLLYALILTGSRSGAICLVVVLFQFFIRSKNKILMIIVSVFALGVILQLLNPNQIDRYASIVDKNRKHSNTAIGRFQGIGDDFDIVLRKPIFGHGLGTSHEANANFSNRDQPSHNLYAEISQELGLIGLIVFIYFIYCVFKNFSEFSKFNRNNYEIGDFEINLNNAMLVWLIMNVIFSFASYGLSQYGWYLFAGLSVALNRIYVNPTAKVI